MPDGMIEWSWLDKSDYEFYGIMLWWIANEQWLLREDWL